MGCGFSFLLGNDKKDKQQKRQERKKRREESCWQIGLGEDKGILVIRVERILQSTALYFKAPTSPPYRARA